MRNDRPALAAMAGLFFLGGCMSMERTALPVTVGGDSGVIVTAPQVYRTGKRLTVRASVRHTVRTAKVIEGTLVVSAPGAGGELGAGRCDARLSVRACYASLSPSTATGPFIVTFRPQHAGQRR
ncbi:hypothetical protein OLX02_06860 [Novosphingobium sp. KCTC 2891]|uniref:hypothetical protein n=1 Tax=Novosphingobium sp. KCTC 2891 TaxID=2989730 RepID=UPI002222AC29|nr:hypothetical protein [Novosphingobium sp. KCTC 2891]MCW1382538.1 hypothetical protein [Novosphingobium sp. KCTC 2891]